MRSAAQEGPNDQEGKKCEKGGLAEGHVPEGLKAPLFASSDRRERMIPPQRVFVCRKNIFDKQRPGAIKGSGSIWSE